MPRFRANAGRRARALPMSLTWKGMPHLSI